MSVRILLLQARTPDDPVREEERRSFAAKAGLREEQVEPHDLLAGPPTMRQVRSYDALMIGGSGDYYVTRGDLPELAALLDLLAEVAAVGHPTFASCFGFQCYVRALGGNLVYDADRIEVGTYELSLTESGAGDELLGCLPRRFWAQMGHKDRAERLPDGVVNLASSELCPFQAFRIPGTPVWATQFHPELDRELNVGRFFRYLEGYAAHMTREERERAMSGFRESPETAKLLPRFLEIVFD